MHMTNSHHRVVKFVALFVGAGFLSAASCGDSSSDSNSNASGGAFSASAGSSTNSSSDDSGLVASTADLKWDIFSDDPKANKDDGKEHPKEAAIKDRDADAASKRDAWNDRSYRLSEEGEHGAAYRAKEHADYWPCRSQSSKPDNC
jgi:hypothetical protein